MISMLRRALDWEWIDHSDNWTDGSLSGQLTETKRNKTSGSLFLWQYFHFLLESLTNCCWIYSLPNCTALWSLLVCRVPSSLVHTLVHLLIFQSFFTSLPYSYSNPPYYKVPIIWEIKAIFPVHTNPSFLCFLCVLTFWEQKALKYTCFARSALCTGNQRMICMHWEY